MADDPLVAVRRDPHFARSLQFLIFFHPAFPGLLPDLQDVKSDAALIVRLEWLLAYETDSSRLSVPFMTLFKPLQPSASFVKLTADSFISLFVRLLEDMEWPVEFPPEAATILELSIPERCRLLCDLCELHLADPIRFQQLWFPFIKDGESSWRIEPVGEDQLGRQYYVFDDGRLYRERSTDPEDWELLAASIREWNLFLQSGLTSKPKDKKLLQFLRNEIFPDTQPILDLVEQEERKMIKEFEILNAPRKRSSRLQAIKQADESKRIEEAEREKEERKRQRLEKEADGYSIISPVKVNKMSREERLRERELKKLISAQPDIMESFADGNSNSNNIDIEESESTIDTNTTTGSQSPIKLIFTRTADGYHSSLLTSDTSIEPIVSNHEALDRMEHDHIPEMPDADSLVQPSQTEEDEAMQILASISPQ